MEKIAHDENGNTLSFSSSLKFALQMAAASSHGRMLHLDNRKKFCLWPLGMSSCCYVNSDYIDTSVLDSIICNVLPEHTIYTYNDVTTRTCEMLFFFQNGLMI